MIPPSSAGALRCVGAVSLVPLDIQEALVADCKCPRNHQHKSSDYHAAGFVPVAGRFSRRSQHGIRVGRAQSCSSMLCMLRSSLPCIGPAVAIDTLALLWRSDAVSADDQRTDIAVRVRSHFGAAMVPRLLSPPPSLETVSLAPRRPRSWHLKVKIRCRAAEVAATPIGVHRASAPAGALLPADRGVREFIRGASWPASASRARVAMLLSL